MKPKLVFLVASFIILCSVLLLLILVPNNNPIAETERTYYGSQQPVFINGKFVAVYEPITSELRQPTLTDKLYYGELNGN